MNSTINDAYMHMMHIACDAHLSAQCISLRMQIKQIITDVYSLLLPTADPL